MTGAKLQARRLRAKVSLRGLAAQMGIAPSYLCDIEKGRRLSQAQIDRAAVVLAEMKCAKKGETKCKS
jgi:transcriptional regulator with XRE-family HTH domain